jgi:hypothetical protein
VAPFSLSYGQPPDTTNYSRIHEYMGVFFDERATLRATPLWIESEVSSPANSSYPASAQQRMNSAGTRYRLEDLGRTHIFTSAPSRRLPHG